MYLVAVQCGGHASIDVFVYDKEGSITIIILIIIIIRPIIETYIYNASTIRSDQCQC